MDRSDFEKPNQKGATNRTNGPGRRSDHGQGRRNHPRHTSGGKVAGVTTGQANQLTGGRNPTPRGTPMGLADPGANFTQIGGASFSGMSPAFPYTPAQGMYHGFPGMPHCLLPFGMGWRYPMMGPGPYSSMPLSPDEMGSGRKDSSQTELDTTRETSQGSRKRPREEDEDVITLLDESEALELVEFDTTVTPKDTWEPPKPILTFLEKHFNKSLTEEERTAILKDFPKPQCNALVAPQLDQQVKEQMQQKGKDPHFGSEKSLCKVQEKVLEVAGPLTCLWADLLNEDASVSPEDILLLAQRAPVLLGSVSHAITVERCKNCLGSHQSQNEIIGY